MKLRNWWWIKQRDTPHSSWPWNSQEIWSHIVSLNWNLRMTFSNHLNPSYLEWWKSFFFFFVLSSCCLVAKSSLTLCDPMVSSPPGSCVHGILQATILEWVAIPFSRGSPWPRDWTRPPELSSGFFTAEPPKSRSCQEWHSKVTLSCMSRAWCLNRHQHTWKGRLSHHLRHRFHWKLSSSSSFEI